MTLFFWLIVLCALVLTVNAICSQPPTPMGLDDWGQPDDESEGWR